MRVTLTINPDTRSRAIAFIEGASEGARVTLIDPPASQQQERLITILLAEMARRLRWHSRKLTAGDWRAMVIASLRKNDVVPGLDPETIVILGDARDELSSEEASNFIEAAYAVAALQGVQLGEAK